jgi:hypothetical protein
MSFMDYYEARDVERREAEYFEPEYCGICGGPHNEKRCDEREDEDDEETQRAGEGDDGRPWGEQQEQINWLESRYDSYYGDE